MWGTEHEIMIFVAFALSAWFLARRNIPMFGAVALSQIPFWIGSVVSFYFVTQGPYGINLAINMMVGGLFVGWAWQRGSDGLMQIWLGILFFFACTLDVVQAVKAFSPMYDPTSSRLYMIEQEIIHYSAFLIIGGRMYVERFDRRFGRGRDRSRVKKGGGVV